MLLHQIVESAAASDPDTTALVYGQRSWTFAEFDELVKRMGSGLAGFLGPGERTVIVADNRPEFVAALYAAPRAGAVLAMANIRHTVDELGELIRSCAPAAVLATGAQMARLDPLRAGPTAIATVRHGWSIDSEPHPETDGDTPEGIHGFSDLLADRILPARQADEREVAWLIHISGTTGRPKGAMLTHRSIEAAVLNTTMARPVASDDVYLFPFPLFHVAAYNVVHHHLRRRPVVLLPRFDPVAVMAAIEQHRVTSISLAPTMVAMLLEHPDRHRFDLSSLRQIGYGAAPMPLDLLRRTLEAWPSIGLAQGYGMTELSGNAVFLGPEEHRRAAADQPALLAAAGRPAPLVGLRIVDETDRELPSGEAGEILVRGDQVCAGYWQDPEATAASRLIDADGSIWLRTGDVGLIDDRGYLHVVDRLKDLIISGGENVSSREVEDVVSGHPSVAAVAAVGVPDERWGERVGVAVVWRDGQEIPAEELIAWTEGRLAGFKRPRVVVGLAELPTNASGKVEKRLVRAAVVELTSEYRSPTGDRNAAEPGPTNVRRRGE